MAKARPITEAEFRRVLAMARTTRNPDRNQLCLLLSARAGMRVGEIGALNIEDVWDFQTNSVRDRIFLSGKRVKWGHAREVFLNRAVRRKLVEYISLREAAPVPLILSRSGRRFGRTALVGLFRELYRKAGIETSSHAGRALFITSLADNGVSIRIIQKAVGHRSLQATNHYMSARPSEIGKAVEFLK